ncbi:MAG: peptidoglycan editing factor PgeF [Clostridiales bacterium]|nr:peptidoglycan editing factor PgeF [Clostridiales bacterium]
MKLPHTHTLSAHDIGGVVYYSFPSFDELPFVRHGFSTRLGGVSDGIWSSMNLGFSRGDDPERVRENYRRICAAMGMDYRQVVQSDQQHHTRLYQAGPEDRGRGIIYKKQIDDVDGLLTDHPHVVLCTLYADCVPLFFVDPIRQVVAASHSGWKGTAARIGSVTVERMTAAYGCRREDILVGIGPSIGPCCFEVDRPVFEVFAAMNDLFDSGCYTASREEGKYLLDLWEINRRILLSAGIAADHITVTDLCTRCHPDLFWSHRAAGSQRGSLAGFIERI